MKAICQCKETTGFPQKTNIFPLNFEFHEPVIGHYIYFAPKYYKINDIVYQLAKQGTGEYIISSIVIACVEVATAPISADEQKELEATAIV